MEIINELMSTLLNLSAGGLLIIIPLIIFYIIQRLFLAAIKAKPTLFIKSIGFLSVPVHEMSHAVMCVVFMHKIEKIRLFDPTLPGNCLGYVEHRYNPVSPFQVIGCFFIGIAPIFGGVFVAYLITSALFVNNQLLIELTTLSAAFREIDELSLLDLYINVITSCFSNIIDAFNQAPIQTTVWFVLTGSIGLYLSPSTADLKGGIKGFIALVVAITLIEWFASLQFDYSVIKSYLVPFSILLMLVVTISSVILIATLILTNIYQSICGK